VAQTTVLAFGPWAPLNRIAEFVAGAYSVKHEVPGSLRCGESTPRSHLHPILLPNFLVLAPHIHDRCALQLNIAALNARLQRPAHLQRCQSRFAAADVGGRKPTFGPNKRAVSAIIQSKDPVLPVGDDIHKLCVAFELLTLTAASACNHALGFVQALGNTESGSAGENTISITISLSPKASNAAINASRAPPAENSTKRTGAPVGNGPGGLWGRLFSWFTSGSGKHVILFPLYCVFIFQLRPFQEVSEDVLCAYPSAASPCVVRLSHLEISPVLLMCRWATLCKTQLWAKLCS